MVTVAVHDAPPALPLLIAPPVLLAVTSDSSGTLSVQLSPAALMGYTR